MKRFQNDIWTNRVNEQLQKFETEKVLQNYRNHLDKKNEDIPRPIFAKYSELTEPDRRLRVSRLWTEFMLTDKKVAFNRVLKRLKSRPLAHEIIFSITKKSINEGKIHFRQFRIQTRDALVSKIRDPNFESCVQDVILKNWELLDADSVTSKVLLWFNKKDSLPRSEAKKIFTNFIKKLVSLSFEMANLIDEIDIDQNEAKFFDHENYTRTADSHQYAQFIKTYSWPCLYDVSTNSVIFKGEVLTLENIKF